MSNALINSTDHSAPCAMSRLGVLSRVNRPSGGNGHAEWMTVLSDETEVVVPSSGAQPSALAIQKAVAIIQSRQYLEQRAVQLIAPFITDAGTWRLVTIDFGAEASRCQAEFLMCFARVKPNAEPSSASPYFEVAFHLPTKQGDDPMFVLSIKTIVGLPIPFA